MSTLFSSSSSFSPLLAIETSSENASVALLHDGQIICRETHGVHAHSQTILPMVQQVLQEAGLRLAQCAAITFGAGPGSFTGVRTACGVAQGLAFGIGAPVIPVVTLLAMAHACWLEQGTHDVLAVLDARMGEVYWAQYHYENENGWRSVIEPTLSLPTEVRPHGAPFLCGDGVTPHAKAIAQLAQEAWRQGQSVAAHEAQPLYLRNKVALTTAERLAQRAAQAEARNP